MSNMADRRPAFALPPIHRWVLLLCALAAGIVGVGCNKKAVYPNVVLISVDTLRADRLGSYGSRAGLTGMMDFWAQRGVRFANAWSAAPWTLPSHASAMTGLYPTEHRAIDDKINIDKAAPMLAERLHAAGFATGAYVSHYYLGEEYGFGRGFDDFFIKPDAKADDMVSKAIRWLERRKKGKPFFLFLHLFDPHAPYQPPVDIAKKHYPADVDFIVPGTTKDIMSVVNQWPSDHAQKTLRALQALYDGEVEFVDKQLEVLFKSLQDQKLDTNTIIILMSDHGEEFMEHGLMEHGFTLYQEQLHVPFIWYYPAAMPSGAVVDEPVSLIDLLPTLLDYLRLPPVEKVSGVSLAGFLRNEKPKFARFLLAETTRQGPDRVAIVKEFKKYIYSPQFRMNGRQFEEKYFNLLDDPGETKNLLAVDSAEAQRLAGQLFSSGLYVQRRVWHLRWAATPGEMHLKGDIEASGRFVYEYKENTIYDTDAQGLMVAAEFPWNKTSDKKLTFLNVDPTANGLTFGVEPETSPVTIQLLFNNKEDPSRVWLGGPKSKPTVGQFTLDHPVALEPGVTAPPPGVVLIWSESLWVNSKQVLRAEVGDPIKLSPQVIEHLRSLGYLQ